MVRNNLQKPGCGYSLCGMNYDILISLWENYWWDMRKDRIGMNKWVNSFFILALLVLSACSTAPTSTVEMEVKQQYVHAQQRGVETIQLDNCKGTTDLVKVVQKNSDSQVEIAGTMSIDKAILKNLVLKQYTEDNQSNPSIELIAAPGTNLVIEVTWTNNKWSGLVIDHKQNRQVNYTIQIPVRVEITKSDDLGCPVVALTSTPTPTPRPPATATFGPSPTRTRTATVTITPTFYTKFNKVWFEYNIVQNNQTGLRIHADFTSFNLRGKALRIAGYFYKASGEKLVDTNGLYTTVDGAVAVVEEFTPVYDNTSYSDFTMFIPNSEFHLPENNRTNCKFNLKVFDKQTNAILGESGFIVFTFGR